MRYINVARVSDPSCARAFTLVELMVVITIISLLAAMLLPALEDAADAARRARCLSNEHAMGIAVGLALNDNARTYPQAGFWGMLLGNSGTHNAAYRNHDVDQRPLNRYLGYRGKGTRVGVAECPGDIGDALYNKRQAYEAFGASYYCPYRFDFNRMAFVFGSDGTVEAATESAKAPQWERPDNKLIIMETVSTGNHKFSEPKHRWHNRRQREFNMLFADLHAEPLHQPEAETEFPYPDASKAPDPNFRWW